MSSPRSTIDVPYTHPVTDEEFVVRCVVSGRYRRASWNEPADGPEVDIVEVVEDRPGGVARPDVLDLIVARGAHTRIEERAIDLATDAYED